MTARELFAGGIGGAAGVCIGHPLDTVRIRRQTMDLSKSPLLKRTHYGTVHFLSDIIKREGVRGVFRGLSPPLFSAALQNSILFFTYRSVAQMLNKADMFSDMSLITQVYISGCMGGLACSVVTSPMELIKCRLQIDRSPPTGSAVRKCISNIIAKEGLRGIYKGQAFTMARDVPSYGVFYLTYELGKKQFGNNATGQLIAGGLAGVISWAVIYPIDVIKTRTQTMAIGLNAPATLSAKWNFAKQVIQREGLSCLTRGLGTTMIRAFPVSAVTFYVYELVIEWF